MRKRLLLMLMLTGFAITVHAQVDQQAPTEEKDLKKNFLYQWTDKKGVAHIVDSLEKVPKQYRDTAKKLTGPKKEDVDQGQQVQQESDDATGADAEEATAGEKAQWQQRMRDARQRLADAEKNYRELVQRRNELPQSWGGPASGRLDTRAEAEKLEPEINIAQREIDKARNDLEVVIPEIARKAGVPPGWLRE
jgi:hypothetical protein